MILILKVWIEMLRENVEDCRWEKDLGGFEGDLRLFGGESEGELSVN